jgi:hypothetical protein
MEVITMNLPAILIFVLLVLYAPTILAEPLEEDGCLLLGDAATQGKSIPENHVDAALEHCRLDERSQCELAQSMLKRNKHALAARLRCDGYRKSEEEIERDEAEASRKSCWTLGMYAGQETPPDEAYIDEALKNCRGDKRSECTMTVSVLKSMNSDFAKRLSCEGPE